MVYIIKIQIIYEIFKIFPRFTARAGRKGKDPVRMVHCFVGSMLSSNII